MRHIAERKKIIADTTNAALRYDQRGRARHRLYLRTPLYPAACRSRNCGSSSVTADSCFIAPTTRGTTNRRPWREAWPVLTLAGAFESARRFRISGGWSGRWGVWLLRGGAGRRWPVRCSVQTRPISGVAILPALRWRGARRLTLVRPSPTKLGPR